MKKTNFKKGISMIVLIITIVVIIILAVTVIVTLNKNNPINSAKEASFKSQVAAYKEAVKLAKMEIIAKNLGDYDTSNDADILTGLGLKGEFAKNLFVKDGELVYVPDIQETKKTMLDSIGLNAGCQIPIKGNLHKEFGSNDQIIRIAPVPEGFVVSSDTTENTIEQGLVIKQGDDPASTTSNEFVWVPVKNPLTDYKRGVTGDMTDINGNLTIGYFEDNTMSENMAIKNSVDKYNGFYIGRYETGLCDNARYSSTVIDGSNFINASPVVKKDAITWNYISQIRAVAESKKIYNTSNVHSTLINSYVWDTMLNYLIASGDKTQYQVVNNCSDFANYFNVEFLIDSNIKYSSDYGKTYQIGLTKKQLNTDYLLTTGATKRNSTKNIYDLAGNIWEWTTEKFNSNFGVFRGGSFAYGNSASTAYRDSLFNQSFSHFGLGFRCMIYMP